LRQLPSVSAQFLRQHRRTAAPHGPEDTAGQETTSREAERLVIVRNMKDEAPNLFLNIVKLSNPGELWSVAVIGILLQFGVVVYSGVISNHPASMFLKGGQLIDGFVYPFASIGTVLLVIGMLICSHVVESNARGTVSVSWTHIAHYLPPKSWNSERSVLRFLRSLR